jgi:hypothetical protein
MPSLPRALRALANDAVVTTDGPSLGLIWCRRRQVRAIVILARRATRVP